MGVLRSCFGSIAQLQVGRGGQKGATKTVEQPLSVHIGGGGEGQGGKGWVNKEHEEGGVWEEGREV